MTDNGFKIFCDFLYIAFIVGRIYVGWVVLNWIF